MRSIACLLTCLLCLLSPIPLGAQLGVSPEPTYLGVRMVDVDADSAVRLKLSDERGVQVREVVDDSPASAAGIHQGDALLSYNGETILGSQQLIRLVRETPPGRKVRVELWRNGKAHNVVVKLGLLEMSRPRVSQGMNATMTSFEVPGLSPSGFPDIPVMLLAWRSTMLGIECEGVTPPLAGYFGVKQGVLVRAVEHGSLGDRAGLKPGDVLVSIDNRPLSGPRDLNAFHRAHQVDAKPIPLAVVRNRQTMKLNLSAPASSPE